MALYRKNQLPPKQFGFLETVFDLISLAMYTMGLKSLSAWHALPGDVDSLMSQG